MKEKIKYLRMERQCLIDQADEAEYIKLYRDTAPGQNVYWNGFGQPPTLSFRAGFDDIEFNRERQRSRKLVKGRFAGGNLGWIEPEEMELFACLYKKPLNRATDAQLRILELIKREGPLNIQQMKEDTGLLVKEITPALHRLQEAFLIYEDQYDGEWDRGWYTFGEMFPGVDTEKYLRSDALKIVLKRFAYRLVWFDTAMAKAFYKLPEKDIKTAVGELAEEGILTALDGGFVLSEDLSLIESCDNALPPSVFAVHRNDFLYKANEHYCKELIKPLCEGLPYDHEPLQYLLIDGEFHGACVGHFRNGPYDLNDIVCDLTDAQSRKEEIVNAVKAVNFGKMPRRFMGTEL